MKKIVLLRHGESVWNRKNLFTGWVDVGLSEKGVQEALSTDSPMFPGNDPRYADLSPRELPLTECLKDTVARFLPYWHETIAPAVSAGKRVIIAAHGNTLRAIVKFLDDISDNEITGRDFPTGIPLVYELGDDLRPIRNYYLGEEAAVRKATQAVAEQLKRKVED